MASLAVTGQEASLSLPVCVFQEENKGGPLCNRKNHFMKLCSTLGPIGGWVTEWSTQEESFPFTLGKRRLTGITGAIQPYISHKTSNGASCAGRKSLRLTGSKVTAADIISVTLYLEH